MLIRVYTSKNGALTIGNGKTLSMVIDLYYLKKKTNKKIFSNFKLKFADYYFNIEDLNEILKNEKNIIIAIDELSSFISAYDSMTKSGKKLAKFIRQIRKRNIEIFITAQVYNDIPASIRRIGIEIIILEKIHGDGSICYIENNNYCKSKKHFYYKKSMASLKRETLTPDLIQIKNNKLYVTENYFYNLYDTNEIIGSN